VKPRYTKLPQEQETFSPKTPSKAILSTFLLAVVLLTLIGNLSAKNDMTLNSFFTVNNYKVVSDLVRGKLLINLTKPALSFKLKYYSHKQEY